MKAADVFNRRDLTLANPVLPYAFPRAKLEARPGRAILVVMRINPFAIAGQSPSVRNSAAGSRQTTRCGHLHSGQALASPGEKHAGRRP